MNRSEKRRQKKQAQKASKKSLLSTHENLAYLFTRAVQYHEASQFKEAKKLYQKILGIKYDIAEVHCNLGSVQSILGDNTSAEKSHLQAISLKPDYADAHGNLGNALSAMGRLEEAITCYKKAIKFNPKDPNIHNSLGSALQELGLNCDAIASFATALSISPEFAEAHSNLGISLKENLRFDEALSSYERALSIRPEFTEAYLNKGNALKDLGRLDDASVCYKKALTIQPNYAEARCNLGNVLMSMGQLNEALNCFKHTLIEMPDHGLATNNYLHTLLYQPDVSNDHLFNTYRRMINKRKPENDPLPLPILGLKKGERIRIGYISSDFRDHPLGCNILPLFSNHDHKMYEIFCYAELSNPDVLTRQFEKQADNWKVIKGLTDTEVADRIRNDRIHVLIYLGGQFDRNRPSVATLRPAPVQISLFSGTTSAIENMDYWLTDDILHPNNTTEKFTEKLWRLPSLFNYPIPRDTPPVSALPADKKGYVTFVSFNKPCKINDEVLDLWSSILSAVPNSRLNLKFTNFLSNPSIRKRILTRFNGNGINSEGMNLIDEKESLYNHLTRYSEADIALDTFPFSGATTTFQALWMGVPVISLMGDRFITRMGGSLTAQIGLEFVITDTPKEYLSQAIELAGNLNHLREIRRTLRQRVSLSSLCDGASYTSNIEAAYQEMISAKLKLKAKINKIV